MTERLDLTSLRAAITSLEEGMAALADDAWLGEQPTAKRNVLLSGIIKNFEFVYEISVKMLRRQLEAEAASPTEIDETSFRDLLRTAAERGLIVKVEAWLEYRHMRNLTAHTYDQDKARQVYAGIPPFLRDAQTLLNKLETRNA